ncbi:isoaspartyl peptidase/L-asparaginase [Infirmifilum lucidum]|uniref:Plant-type L-asparaginase n=1 Tax=Infirmifilum lucidum TaxID=2776706 RepID=A0A7L9FIR1_9CREN|nr:isoaspartyl peptidase/L-asparaginase [Infirmifilum lucidum]QOJ79521.1 isoaspartyl peptidase/L-asparaginase [Infirmifilum lucidum]
MTREVLVIHGGAGRFRPSILEERDKLEEALRTALSNGERALASGNALDAVEEAVKTMEDSGVFNAGKGAALNLLGEQELDASIMFGRDLSFGAVASVKYTWNAVSLARKVMERTDHVLLVGSGADRLAEILGFEVKPPPPEKLRERYLELSEKLKSSSYDLWRKNFEIARLFFSDTVGAVALDREGNLAAATSTGGLWLKFPGRVGDTPLPGAGVYAENGVVAVSATGIGEIIARYLAAARVAFKVESGLDVVQAVREVVDEVTRLFSERNTIGLIALDPRGNIGMSSNCEVFLRGYVVRGEQFRVAVLANEELS